MKRLSSLFLVLSISLSVFAPFRVLANKPSDTGEIITKQEMLTRAEAKSESKKFSVAEAFVKDSLLKLKKEKTKSLIVEFEDDHALSALQAIKKIDGVKIKWEYNNLIKGASFSIPVEKLADFAKIEGIKHIEENKPVIPMMNNSKAMVDLVKWKSEKKGNYNFDGRGMVIALLDSGVDTRHKDIKHMDEDAREARKIKTITQVPEHTKNPFNDKVPHGFNYVEGNYILTDDVYTPHGQHIAGTLVGNSPDAKNGNGVVGIAPNAQLLAYKVFSDDRKKPSYPGNDSVYHAILDAIAHGADVISLSIGLYGSGLKNDIYNSIIKKATDAGVVVVAAMGNWSASSSSSTYDRWANKAIPTKDTSAMVSIAATPYALGVGSAQNIYVDADTMLLDGEEIPNYPVGIYTEDLIKKEPKGNYKIFNAGFLRKNEFDELMKKKDEIKGGVLIVKRGINVVSEKIHFAQQLEAKGLILINGQIHESRDDFRRKVVTDYTFIRLHITWKKGRDGKDERDREYKLDKSWAVTITGADGEKILNKVPKLGDQSSVNLEFKKENHKIKLADENKPHVSGFSSWGPTIDLELKPEIVAPGQDIYSTFNVDENGKHTYGYLSGTSMATPHVAGLATLLLQKVREIAPLQKDAKSKLTHYKSGNLIDLTNVDLTKALLMNTAIPVIDQKTDGLEYSPRVQGAGMANIDRAFNTDVLVVSGQNKKKAYVALKEIGQKAKFSVIMHNFGNKTRNFDIKNAKVLAETVIEQNKEEFNDDTGTKLGKLNSEGTMLIEKVNEIHPKELKNANLKSSSSVSISPKTSVEIHFELDTGEAKDEFVEGYIYFISKDNEQSDLSIPYFGFKGNWAGERIIDLPVWEKGSLLKFTSVFSEKKGQTGHDNTNYLELGKENKQATVIPQNIAITSSDSGISSNNGISTNISWATNKNIVPRFMFIRDAVDYEADILNANNEVVTKVNVGHFPEKALYYKYAEGYISPDSYKINADFKWEGKYFDQTTGDEKAVKEGQYYYRLRARIAKDKPWEELKIPVYVDNTAPTVTYTHDSANKTLDINATDANNRPIWFVGVTLDNEEQKVEKIAEGKYQVKNLTLNENTTNRLKIYVLDYAGLTVEKEEDLTKKDGIYPVRPEGKDFISKFLARNYDKYEIKREDFHEKTKSRAAADVIMWNWAMYGQFVAHRDGRVKDEPKGEDNTYQFKVPVRTLVPKTKVVIESRNMSKTDPNNKYSDPAGLGKNFPVLDRFTYGSTNGDKYRDNYIKIKEGWNYIYVTAYKPDYGDDDAEEDEDSWNEDEDSWEDDDGDPQALIAEKDLSKYKYKKEPDFAEGYVVYYDEHAPRMNFISPVVWNYDKYDDKKPNPSSGATGQNLEGKVFIVDGKVKLEGTIADNGNAWLLKINENIIDYFNNYEKENENMQKFSFVREAKAGDVFEINIEDGQKNARKFKLTAEEAPKIPDFTIEGDKPEDKINLKFDRDEDEESDDEDSEYLTEDLARKIEKNIKVNGQDYQHGKKLQEYKLKDSDAYYIEATAFNKAGIVKTKTKKIGSVPEFKEEENGKTKFTLKANEVSMSDMNKALELSSKPEERTKLAKILFNTSDDVKVRIKSLTKVDERTPLSLVGQNKAASDNELRAESGTMKMIVEFEDPYGQSFEKEYIIRVLNFGNNKDLKITLKKDKFTLDELKDLNNLFQAEDGASFVLVNPIQVPESGLSEKVKAKIRVFKEGKQNEQDFEFVLLQNSGLDAELKKSHFYPEELYDINNVLKVPEGVKVELLEPKQFSSFSYGELKFKVKLIDKYGQEKIKEYTIGVVKKENYWPDLDSLSDYKPEILISNDEDKKAKPIQAAKKSDQKAKPQATQPKETKPNTSEKNKEEDEKKEEKPADKPADKPENKEEMKPKVETEDKKLPTENNKELQPSSSSFSLAFLGFIIIAVLILLFIIIRIIRNREED